MLFAVRVDNKTGDQTNDIQCVVNTKYLFLDFFYLN